MVSNITICVRKKPGIENDYIQIKNNSLKISKDNVKLDLRPCKLEHSFTFDHIFDNNTNIDIFNKLYCKKIPNKSIYIAYGHTGTGKTFTILGSKKEKGLLHHFLDNIFDEKNNIIITAFELYNKKLFDLLNNKNEIFCRHDRKNQINICNIKEFRLKTFEDITKILEKIKKNRITSKTNANNNSFRSHAIIELKIKIKNRYRKITFVDLAGNERGANSNYVNKYQYRENQEINNSLLSLKECIRSLYLKKKYIPYRSSKLTTILKDSFGKKVKTVFLSTISGDQLCYYGTIDTLKYTNYVKNLKTDFKSEKFLPKIKPKPIKKNKITLDQSFRKYLLNISDLVAKGFIILKKEEIEKIEGIKSILSKNIYITRKWRKKIKTPEPPCEKPDNNYKRPYLS